MREGDVVADRYRIRRTAGSGGMGTVYEALDTSDGSIVALKTWLAAPHTEPRARSRLFREAHALSEIRHPAVVRYVDHGTTAEHGPFLVMAWVGGETLSDCLQTRGLTVGEALRLTIRLAAGLASMHAAGIVHRDLKPSNVMLDGGDVDRAVIVDFGVARVAHFTEGNGGEERGHLGTARYMAPEQIRNARTVDGRADVFALGCILFEALTGRPAFEGVDPVTVLARILFEPLPVPSTVRPALPESLDRLVLTLLVREVERRPFAEAVAALVRAEPPGSGGALASGLPAAPSVEIRGAPALDHTLAAESMREPPSPVSRHHAVRDAQKTRRALPVMAGAFFGREDESRHLSALLRAGTKIVTVWGGPGIGKTRLIADAVLRVAEEAASPWDAVVFGDLADARDADDVARIVARAAGVALESSSPPEVALGNALAKLGRVVLVVDPVDHLLTPLTAALIAWQHAAPGLQVVAASRTRWRPPSAVAIEVGPLATRGEAGGPSAAARLFLDRAFPRSSSQRALSRDDGAGTLVDAERARRAEELAHALDGIPLAIELYAARAEVLGIDALFDRLPGKADSDATLDVSEGAMSRAIAWSWQLLNPAEQRAFAQCSVFRGGFTPDAAAHVVDAGDGAGPLDLLRSLREKSLLCTLASDAAGEERLTMFASVREFAWRMLESGADIEGALKRHAAHYAEAFAAGTFADSAAATPRIEREAENLFAAAEYSLSEEGADVEAGMLALVALEPAMVARGAIGSYRGLLDRAVRVAELSGARTEILGARVRQIRARLEAPRGHLARAKEDLARCLALSVRENDDRWRGEIELDRGVALHLGRELGAARASYEVALALLSQTDAPRAEARCIGNLGALCHDEGDFAGAARWYRRAIALFEQVGDARQRANCASNLAVLEQELGHHAESRDLYVRAVLRLEEVGDARLLAITLGNFGVLELELGHPERALEHFERSAALLAGSGDRRSEALCAGRLGAALALLGRINDADAKLVSAERLVFGEDRLVVEAIRLLGEFVALAKGEAIDAVRHRLDRVTRVDAHGRSLRDQSDDIRSTLRILATELERRA